MEDMENSVVAQDANVVVENTTDNLGTPDVANVAQGAEHVNTPVEKSFSQDEVNKLIGAAKLKEREKALNATKNTQEAQQSYEPPQAVQASQNFDINAEVNRVLQQKQEEIEAAKAYEQAQGIINNFSQKVIEGKDKYEDFDSKLTHVNLENPALIMSLKDLDNPADVLYALGEDPSTYLEIVNGLNSDFTAAAAKAKVDKIANAIKNNEEARKLHNKGHIPSKIKSSPVSTGNQRSSHSEMLNSKDFMW